jgi:glutamate--cysteine ligase
LLYDQTALDAAWDLVRDWTAGERQSLRDRVPKSALQTTFRNTTVLALARQMLAIARAGLRARSNTDAQGRDESRFLEPIEWILRDGCTPAEEMLARYRDEWGQKTDPLFLEYAF